MSGTHYIAEQTGAMRVKFFALLKDTQSLQLSYILQLIQLDQLEQCGLNLLLKATNSTQYCHYIKWPI